MFCFKKCIAGLLEQLLLRGIVQVAIHLLLLLPKHQPWTLQRTEGEPQPCQRHEGVVKHLAEKGEVGAPLFWESHLKRTSKVGVYVENFTIGNFLWTFLGVCHFIFGQIFHKRQHPQGGTLPTCFTISSSSVSSLCITFSTSSKTSLSYIELPQRCMHHIVGWGTPLAWHRPGCQPLTNHLTQWNQPLPYSNRKHPHGSVHCRWALQSSCDSFLLIVCTFKHRQ